MINPYIMEIVGARATLTLNRPERHNSLDGEDLKALTAVLGGISTGPDLRVLVLTGTGDKSFCSGVTLSDIGHTDWSKNPLALLSDQIQNLPFLTICALNGSVYGGGSDLALACDFRIGVVGMRAFVPPARLGIHYHISGLQRAVQRLGLSAAKRLFLAAETFDDQELLRLQFIDRLVPRSDFTATVDWFANDLMGLAPLAVRGMKQALNHIAAGTLDLATTAANIQACWASEDFREGQTASAQKRPPQFKGC